MTPGWLVLDMVLGTELGKGAAESNEAEVDCTAAVGRAGALAAGIEVGVGGRIVPVNSFAAAGKFGEWVAMHHVLFVVHEARYQLQLEHPGQHIH